MELFSVLAKVLGAGHGPTHRFQDCLSALRNLVPSSLETGDRRGA